MKPTTYIAGVGLLSAILLAGYFQLGAKPQPPVFDNPEATTHTSDEVAQLKQTVAQQHRRIAELSRNYAVLAQKTTTTPPESEGPSPQEAPPEDNERPEEPAPAAETPPAEASYALEERLEEVFAAQATEDPWDVDATEQATAAIQAALPESSSVFGMECRGDLCRVEIDHQNRTGPTDFVQQWLENSAKWPGPATLQMVEQPDGRLSTIAFLGQSESNEDLWRMP